MSDITKARITFATTPSGAPKSKKAQLIKLLRAKAGSDIASLSTKLGWQHHTTRAALSGLRKAGHEIVKVPPTTGGLALYRIATVECTDQDTPLGANDGA